MAEVAPRDGSRPAESRAVIVTAAADGIGAATARLFAQSGYPLVLVDIDVDGLARTQAECGDAATLTAAADVTDEASVQSVVDAALDRFGRIEALVNVVGGSRPGKTVVELGIGEWNQLLALNLTSTFLMCRAVIPHMERSGGGSIVNVSSGAGLRGMSRNPGYCAAKAGVVALTRALAIDHGPNGVRVNAVAPGPIRTPLMQRNRTEDEIATMGRLAVAGRIGEPNEIAAAILWLASDGASYVMGQTIEVDGGPASLI
jgi:NAD(P)-dependent dehydrogenase (short-subunit alcohol dehydrogenase family)